MKLLILAGLIFVSPALAKDPSGIADECVLPAACHQWFQTLMQPDVPTVSCCGMGDAFEADSYEAGENGSYAIITDGRGKLPNGMKVPVPVNKFKWDQGNPTGHGIIFLAPDATEPAGVHVYCYVTPGGV